MYRLGSEDGCEEFRKELSGSGLYTFTFNYRENYEGINAFLVGTEHGVYLLAGQKMEFSFVGLDEAGSIDEVEEESVEEEELDFSMT